MLLGVQFQLLWEGEAACCFRFVGNDQVNPPLLGGEAYNFLGES